MDDDAQTARGVHAAATGGMLALVRVHAADRDRDRLRVGVYAAEAALWVRALDDIFRALDPRGRVLVPAPARDPGVVPVSDASGASA